MDEIEEKPEVVTDWWFLAIDQTKDWNLDLLPHAEHIDKILTVLQFDRNRHVHCCEITPSYECWPVEYKVRFKERPDVRYGLTAMCVGLGQGGSVIWENPYFDGKKKK